MKVRKTTGALILIMLIASGVKAQFWFGPIGGFHISHYNFLDQTRKSNVKVPAQASYHLGLAMDYSTESAFEVHTELKYSNIRVNSSASTINPGYVDQATGQYIEEPTRVQIARSEMVHHVLTLPAMARVVLFQRSKVKFLGEVGPQLSYWLGSSGKLRTDVLEEFGEIGGESGRSHLKQTVVFSKIEETPDVSTDLSKFYVSKPNRLQYGLGVGIGAVWDITPERRVIVDAKYVLGHSIMAFNNGNGGVMASEEQSLTDRTLTNEIGYVEDTEYQTHMFSVSAAVMFGWNPNLSKKGRSTSKISRQQRKKH